MQDHFVTTLLLCYRFIFLKKTASKPLKLRVIFYLFFRQLANERNGQIHKGKGELNQIREWQKT